MHHKNLNAWQKAMDLVVTVYETSKDFPKEEKFGLTNQLRRSAVSIPSNIAEGAAERSQKDYRRYLTMALGSTNELETQLLISKKLNYHDDSNILLEVQNVRKLLYGLIKYVNKKS